MSSNTNLYAQIKRSEALPGVGGRDWHDVTPSELWIWIGIIIYMGLFSGKSMAAREFWLHIQHHPTHDISKFISQTRFEQIKRFFHLSNPEEDQAERSSGHRLWHQKVDPRLNQLRLSSQGYLLPSSNVTIDAAMILCTGRSIDTYNMPNKPIKLGYKFHFLANRGYIVDFLPTSSKSGLDLIPSIPELSYTGSSVYHLASTLQQLDRRHAWNLYVDIFYTSFPLFKKLREIGIGAVGTARTSSKDFPQSLKIPKQVWSKLEYHSKGGIVTDGIGFLL